MKCKAIKLLDTVALLEDLPARKLRAGEVGTVVEILDDDVFEVEFCDAEGETYAQFALRSGQIMPLHSRGKSLRAVLEAA
jgi:predicted nucleic-acid-binding protein